MTQTEMRARTKFKCIHGHTGLAHPRCYDEKNQAQPERIGFCDIEASNLVATFGICYTYCIKEVGKNNIIKRQIQLEDLYNGRFDRNLVKQFCKDAREFDRLIFHYGENRRFDTPFLRTRAEYWKLPFPRLGEVYLSDTYPILKNRFRLHSNRLEVACDFFGIPAKGHKLNPHVWLAMLTGNPKKMKKALDYILVHNVEDVVAGEELWNRISPYVKLGRTSI